MLGLERQDGLPSSASGMPTLDAYGSPDQPILRFPDQAGHNSPPLGGKCCKCHIIALGYTGATAICPLDAKLNRRFGCDLPTNTLTPVLTAGKRIALLPTGV